MKRDLESVPASGEAPSATRKRVRVFIVEDDPRPRASLRALLEGTQGFCCCGACRSGEEALRLAPEVAADVVLMDIKLPGMNGVACTRDLKNTLPNTQILMLTQHDDPELVFQALAAGADGYLMKYEAPVRVLDAIEEVYRGGGIMSPAVARLVMMSFQRSIPSADLPADAELSPRETQLLELMRNAGLSTTKELADYLSVSPRTIESHLRSIYEKLHVHTRTAALARFVARRTTP